MKFSVSQNALILIADGGHALLYRNSATDGLKLEKTGELSPENDGQGPSPMPIGTTPTEHGEANFARQIADYLYETAQRDEFQELVLVADPQTLGQIRPSLHQEVKKRIVGELNKTLTKSSVSDIERSILAAMD